MNVLIIESAAKGKTLQKFLNSDWVVIATGGHVETLPHDRRAHGKDATKGFWNNRPGKLPNPPWVWTERGESALQAIVKAGGDSPVFWIATDPDREGEFIAWSLEKHLKSHGVTHRVSFQEVTKDALLRALESPKKVDQAMVESALVRKFLDRLVGFRTSKLAGSVVGRGASMGRVQTPALGFVVERELEREAFVPTPYFEVKAVAEGLPFEVLFHDVRSVDVWRDESGRMKRNRTFSAKDADFAFDALTRANTLELITVQRRKPSSRRPGEAFTTDTLLQEAGNRFGWSPAKTSKLASTLYEQGHITYIRTDSTRLADSAVQALREVVAEEFGGHELADVRSNKGGSNGGQDAHEAIRPTSVNLRSVDLGDEQAERLYRLIRARALATQMQPSVGESVGIEAKCAGMDWLLSTSIAWRSARGWERAYTEFEPPRPTSPPELPMEVGARWRIDAPADGKANPTLIEDETKPPSRYRPHRLVALMKEAGIGRPSTYARTIEKLSERKYVKTEDGALVPTSRGRVVWTDVAPLYALGEADAAAVELFDTDFTAQMEDGLDEIAHGRANCAERWENWRDHVRDLHNAALDRKKEGKATPRQKDLIHRLLKNAGPEVEVAKTAPERMTYQQAMDFINRLRQSGVQPSPTQPQLDYIGRLLEDLALPDDTIAEILGVESVEDLRTSAAASDALEKLKKLAEDRKPPSAEQRRFIESLLVELELGAAAAAELIGVVSLDDLTGGAGGTASELIEALKELKELKGKAEASKSLKYSDSLEQASDTSE